MPSSDILAQTEWAIVYEINHGFYVIRDIAEADLFVGGIVEYKFLCSVEPVDAGGSVVLSL